MPETDKSGAGKYKDKLFRHLTNGGSGELSAIVNESLRFTCFSIDRGATRVGPGWLDLHICDIHFGSNALYADVTRQSSCATFKGLTKRIIDILGASVGIILTAVPMLIIALIIKAMSRGPVFYRQDRIGLMGKKFTPLKFRTMVTNATEDTHKNFVTSFIYGSDTVSDRGSEKSPVYKLQLDPRITPVGRFLRKWSLDELPQLFNILKGEMAIVGPRPPIPYEVEQYKPWHLGRIYDVKPGLTGLWQVSGRSRTSFEEMVRLDLQYVNHWSLGYDLKIVFETFGAVLSTNGAF